MTDDVNVPEVGMEDAPDWYCHDSASGWACGWNACREYLLAAAPSSELPTTEELRDLVTDEQVRFLVSSTDVAQGRARLRDILAAIAKHKGPQ